MFARAEYAPLSQINTDRVRFQLSLPEYDDAPNLLDSIGINVRRVERLMKIGGIRSLEIGNADNGTSSYDVAIVGRNRDGTAIPAARAVLNEKAIFEGHNSRSGILSSIGEWTDATVGINTEEISKRILDNKKQIRRPDSWAPYLDQALKNRIQQVGLDQLVFSYFKTVPDTVFTGLFNGTASAMGALVALDSPTVGALTFITFHGYVTGYQYFGLKGSGYKEFHPSLLAAPQVDRAAVLYVATKTKPLVKALPQAA